MANIPCNIRRAKKEDCAEICRLIKEMAVFEKMPNSTRVTIETLEKDGFDTQPPLYQSIVVEDPNQDDREHPRKLIGYAVYYIGYSTWSGKKFYLEDIFVEENFRKKGIGKQLFKHICKEAVKCDSKIMNFTCLDWNPAKEFYKSFGAEDITENEQWHFFVLPKEKFSKAAES